MPFTDHIEMHVLELPKFDKRLPDLGDDLDKWLYFLRHAATLDVNHWPPELAAPPWQRAGKELNMLAQTDIQREIYEARHKGQLDHLTDLRVERRLGQDEGRLAGLVQGRVFAEIQMLQRFLRLPVTDGGTLEAKSADEVSRLRDELATAARAAGIELS